MKVFRYFARTYGLAIVMTFVGLSVVVVAANLVESGSKLRYAEDPAMTALKLAGFRAVVFGFQILPGSCFLGALVAGTMLARRGELLAAQAAGVSAARLWLTFIVVAAAVATVGWGAGEWLVPHAVAGAERVRADEIGRADALTRFYERRTTWFRDGDFVLYLPTVDSQRLRFENPVLYRWHDGNIDAMYYARTLAHDGTTWFLERATVLQMAPSSETTSERLDIQLGVRPQDLADVAGDPRQMGSQDIRNIIARREAAHLDATGHRVELHSRWAYPLGCVVMVLLVAPWALHPDRRRSLASTLGTGAAFIGILFAVSYVFRMLALGNKVPPFLGAWGFILACALAVWPNLVAYRRYRVRGSLM